MTNKTQCPNCLTVYIITDEQVQKSKGKVRCGTCRQPFTVSFISDNQAAVEPQGQPQTPHTEMARPAWPGSKVEDAAEVANQEPTAPIEMPSFPDRESDTDAAQLERSNIIKSSSITGEDLGFTDETKSFFVEPLSSNSIQAMLDSEPAVSRAIEQRKDSSFENNLSSELSINVGEPDREHAPENTESGLNTDDDQVDTQSLIDQVNDLIADKLVEEAGAGETGNGYLEAESEDHYSDMVVLDEPFVLDGRRPVSSLNRWVLSPLLVMALVCLSIVFVYQLWLRQALPWFENDNFVERVAPLVSPTKELLQERFNVVIPERRDLANLQLLSARVEPHPSRPSTTLLKVSLLNKSEIAQPFPWLELVLSDENGRLVSRRALSPSDYLHKNRLSNMLRSQELRPVTIELLAFPRQAHGYELKIINR